MLRHAIKLGRPLFSNTKSVQKNIFNRNTTVTNLFVQRQILFPTQYRYEATDLAMGVQFPIKTEKLQDLLQRIERMGGVFEEKVLSFQVYYDSVPKEEEIDVEAEMGASRYDVTTPEGREETRVKGPDEGRSKPAPRAKMQKRDDSALYVLTKRDMWLSNQDGMWFLKVPAVDETGRTHMDVDVHRRIPVYREAEGERAIRRELSLQQDETQEARTGVRQPSLEEDLASRMGVVPYAAFKNTQYLITVSTPRDFEIGKEFKKENEEEEEEEARKKKDKIFSDPDGSLFSLYSSTGYELSLEINETDFGYAVGSLSIPIENPDEEAVEEKMDHIASFLQALDVDVISRANTTILEYLERNRPNHFKHLISTTVARIHAEKKPKETKEETKEE